MPEPLDVILNALSDRQYRYSLEVWKNFVMKPDRPHPFTVIDAIISDEPEIVEDYADDKYGASCLILAYNGNGRGLHTVIGYGVQPIKIITAYRPDPNEWIDDRRRRG